MITNEKNNNVIWKSMIFFTLIFSLISVIILLHNNSSTYEYNFKLIELNNTNFGEDIWVVDYLCEDGIYVNNIKSRLFNIHHFYASTWIDAEVENGKCMIKYKVKVK